MSAESLESLQGKFGEAIRETVEFRGEHTAVVALDAFRSVMEHAEAELGFDLLLDICSLDHMGDDPRFEVVYELATADDSKHLRVRVAVPEDTEIPTVSDLWSTANWHEREVYDMMGISFSDHPNMKRILMWDGYPYFPLRKDFPLAGKPSEMPDVAFTGIAPLEGGPFVTSPGTDRITGEPRAKGES